MLSRGKLLKAIGGDPSHYLENEGVWLIGRQIS